VSEEEPFSQLKALKLIAQEYNCTVIDGGRIIHIFSGGKSIHEFTKEGIIYYQGSMRSLFEEVKEKL
jgi:hypothetical protein